jgi:hypothetical protein
MRQYRGNQKKHCRDLFKPRPLWGLSNSSQEQMESLTRQLFNAFLRLSLADAGITSA